MTFHNLQEVLFLHKGQYICMIILFIIEFDEMNWIPVISVSSLSVLKNYFFKTKTIFNSFESYKLENEERI